MIPAIFRTEAERATTPNTPERAAALVTATKQSSAAIGVIGAVGAIGGFLIPIAFSLAVGRQPAVGDQGRVRRLRLLLRRLRRRRPTPSTCAAPVSATSLARAGI